MKTCETGFSAGLVCVISVACVVVALTFGVPAVRADSEISAASLQELVVAPMMRAVHSTAARFAGLEATVDRLRESFTSRQIVAQELCVADQTGAQTCVTKAQIDAMIGAMVRVSAPATAAPGSDATALGASALVAPAIVTPVTVETLVIMPAIVVTMDNATKAVETAAVETNRAEIVASENGANETAPIETTGIGTRAVAVPASEPTPIETTGIGTTRTEIPAEAAAEELLNETLRGEVLHTEEPVTTGSITPVHSGLALVSPPDVEISIAVPGSAGD